MSVKRTSTLFSLAKGLVIAIAVTLLGMFLIAAVAVVADIPDSLLATLNQLLKLSAVLLGVCVCVERGGSNGFVTGAALGLLYMTLGYGLYATLSKATLSVTEMLGEMLMGAAVGAVCGAIRVNMKSKSRRRHR